MSAVMMDWLGIEILPMKLVPSFSGGRTTWPLAIPSPLNFSRPMKIVSCCYKR
jgi:hypothetical protein